VYVYAGIDEAGYGPMFGPLLVGRMVLGFPSVNRADGDDAAAPFTGKQLWKKLSKAVCKDLTNRKGRIAVNDSKKLKLHAKHDSGRVATAAPSAVESESDGVESIDAAPPAAVATLAAGTAVAPAPISFKHLEHLERGVLAFSALAGQRAANVCEWLDGLGEVCHHNLTALPWYEPTDAHPWNALPCACTEGEIAVARNMLAAAAKSAGVEVLDLGAAVVFEDRFNKMAAATRSKAATSFTFVAGHLRAVWDNHGQHNPNVIVDRQSGRMHYRELLAMNFPEADLTILDETPERSAYRLIENAARANVHDTSPRRAMTVSFEVDSEAQHMPVALASMISKYTRELLMARFQTWFQQRAPHIRPTAGYALDAKRFWEEIQPLLPQLSIAPHQLARCC